MAIRAPRLYALADREILAPRRLADMVEAMAEAGVRWIQVRAKATPGELLRREVEECCRRLESSDVKLWLDDRADLAALLPVAGLHLGQQDLPPAAARELLGEAGWLGMSTHDPTQLVTAVAEETVDVVAVGPVFATAGKADPDPVVGLGLVAAARRLTARPVVAIGGIDASNAARVLAAGADAVAVLGAVCRGDVPANCRHLLAVVGELP